VIQLLDDSESSCEAASVTDLSTPKFVGLKEECNNLRRECRGSVRSWEI